MSNGARQFPETGDFAPFCANRFCADGLFYFHVELFRCAGGIASAEAKSLHQHAHTAGKCAQLKSRKEKTK